MAAVCFSNAFVCMHAYVTQYMSGGHGTASSCWTACNDGSRVVLFSEYMTPVSVYVWVCVIYDMQC